MNKPYFVHLMMDIETFSTQQAAHILQVAFYPFHANAKIERLPKTFVLPMTQTVGRKKDQDTIDWWEHQDINTQKAVIAASEEQNEQTHDVLRSIQDYFFMWHTSGFYTIVWGSAAFDNSNMRSLFEDYNIDCPWGYRDNMCYRTIREIYGHTFDPDHVKQFIREEFPNLQEHMAAFDAMVQGENTITMLGTRALEHIANNIQRK